MNLSSEAENNRCYKVVRLDPDSGQLLSALVQPPRENSDDLIDQPLQSFPPVVYIPGKFIGGHPFSPGCFTYSEREEAIEAALRWSKFGWLPAGAFEVWQATGVIQTTLPNFKVFTPSRIDRNVKYPRIWIDGVGNVFNGTVHSKELIDEDFVFLLSYKTVLFQGVRLDERIASYPIQNLA